MMADRRSARLTLSLSGTNLSRAGDYNQRVVLQAVRQRGETTRVELAGLTGLTAPTIAKITRRLEADGLIRQQGRIRNGRGQPAFKLAINPDGAIAIGLNIDRDHLTLACVDLDAQLRASVTREIHRPSPSAVEQFLATTIDPLIADAAVDRQRVIGIGIAMPDDFGAARSGTPFADLAAWQAIDVPGMIGRLTGWPVHTDNDAAAAALAEQNLPSGAVARSQFYLLLNAGLGGGMVLDGGFYRGATGRSGEIGYLPMAGGGTVETVVSLSALFARLAAAGCDEREPSDLIAPSASARAIIERWLDDAAVALADPVVAVDCLLNPDEIVIGGRLPAGWLDRLIEKLEQRRDEHGRTAPTRAAIRRAHMADIAPAFGAALLPFSDRLLPSDAILMNAGVAPFSKNKIIID